MFHSFDLVGTSSNVTSIKDLINKLALSDSRIFISGPTGSGKELIARKIHNKSKRNNGPFIILNGALLDIKKYEEELFGVKLNQSPIQNENFQEKKGVGNNWYSDDI